MNKAFVMAKSCYIPGFFNDHIHVLVEETVPDDVLVAYAKSLVRGGNFNINELTLSKPSKIKLKVFDKTKTIIPEKFYSAAPRLEDITVVPFKPVEGYKVQNAGLYSEQYLVKYAYTGDDALCKFDEEIFCVENNRSAHQQVENFAKNYLSAVKHLKCVKITSVTYC